MIPQPSDQTETLPAVEDDIFATFSGPIPQVGSGRGAPAPYSSTPYSSDPYSSNPDAYPPVGPDGGAGDPLNDWREGDDQPQRPAFKLPEGRVLLLAGAGGLVLVLIVLVALITGGGGGTPDKPPRTAVAAKATVNTTSDMPGKSPDGLKRLGEADATALLRKAGQNAEGTIVDAWSWDDKNGHNLVVTSAATTKAGKQSLRVIHVSGLDGTPKTLRIMRDPNLPNPCSSTGTAGFAKDGLVIRDLDSNGIAEVMVGWSSRCGGKGTNSEVKLALITNGQKYIIRGQGVIGNKGSGDLAPAPKASSWPKSYYPSATQLFHKLYY